MVPFLRTSKSQPLQSSLKEPHRSSWSKPSRPARVRYAYPLTRRLLPFSLKEPLLSSPPHVRFLFVPKEHPLSSWRKRLPSLWKKHLLSLLKERLLSSSKRPLQSSSPHLQYLFEPKEHLPSLLKRPSLFSPRKPRLSLQLNQQLLVTYHLYSLVFKNGRPPQASSRKRSISLKDPHPALGLSKSQRSMYGQNQLHLRCRLTLQYSTCLYSLERPLLVVKRLRLSLPRRLHLSLSRRLRPSLQLEQEFLVVMRFNLVMKWSPPQASSGKR